LFSEAIPKIWKKCEKTIFVLMSVIVVFRVEMFKSYFSSHVGMTKMSPGAAMGKTSKAENSREREREKRAIDENKMSTPQLYKFLPLSASDHFKFLCILNFVF
jgi:hypothetical protein